MEIALIKLCRPAMETNLDSVLDRLRVLEQRMDERPVQQVIVQQGSGKMPAETGAVQEPAGNKAPAKAAPEDLQKIVAGWRVITGQTTGMFKQMLQKSVPKYNSETGEPVLLCGISGFSGAVLCGQSGSEERAQDIITAQTGKTVEIQMLVADKHQHTNLANITVDQAIKNNIHMDVVIEEDPDEEKGE